ncbi:MAG: SCO family protein [Ignavibacteria bacterium]|nr:SCO family protein [Ignavibacteria bacterium]
MKKIFTLGLIVFTVYSCAEKFEVIDDLSKDNFSLVDQTSTPRSFPATTKGKLTVISYIFTNCPDICPLTTNNMRLIQEKVNEAKIQNVNFVSISFDPTQDKPETLRKFAEVRNLDLSNWIFLTGDKSIVDSLMNRIGILAVVSDSTVFKDGRKIYYYTHTDRIQLMDEEGKIRKNYKGSNINTEEIVRDIKSLQ